MSQTFARRRRRCGRRSRLHRAARPASLAAVLAVACLATGCAGRATLSQWAQSSGVVGLDNTVAGDVHDVQGANKAHESAKLIVTICDALYDDSNQAYDSVLPAPNAQVTNELNNAYINLENGAQDCSTSVGGSDAASTVHAYGEISAGVTELDAATRLLASLGVH